MADKKRILYVQTSGVDTPERLYSPFVLATVAASMNLDATIYFLGKGVTACDQSSQLMNLDRGDYIDGVEVVGSATLNDLSLDADSVLSF